MKTCKQCHRQLDDSCFRPTKSRGKGLRQSKTGTKTICRQCESINTQAHNIVAAMDAGKPVNEEKLKQLKRHYQLLMDLGHPLVTAAARRLMGIDAESSDGSGAVIDADADLYEHILAVKNRSYSSFDEADEVHSRLTPRLRAAGLYEDVNNLMDRWFEEG